jgi:hypothetical protein
MNPHGRKGYSAAIDGEYRDMRVKRGSAKTQSRRVFGHPGKLLKPDCAPPMCRSTPRISRRYHAELCAARVSARSYRHITLQVKQGGSGSHSRRLREKLM